MFLQVLPVLRSGPSLPPGGAAASGRRRREDIADRVLPRAGPLAFLLLQRHGHVRGRPAAARGGSHCAWLQGVGAVRTCRSPGEIEITAYIYLATSCALRHRVYFFFKSGVRSEAQHLRRDRDDEEEVDDRLLLLEEPLRRREDR